MATFRQIQTSFWQDPFILDLTPEEKYFYIYLMTNSKTTQCGIYEISKRIMEMETGYNRETVDKLLQRFIDYKKILYSDETREIMLINWPKYNNSDSPKVKKCIESELSEVKSRYFVEVFDSLSKDYGYSIDRLSIDSGEEQEKEQEKEQEEEKEQEKKSTPPYQEITNLYLENCPSLPKVRDITDKRRKTIKAMWIKFESLEAFKELFTKAESSDFLSGRSGDWTGCGFDWLMNTNNAVKVLEGNYDNKGGGQRGRTSNTGRGDPQKHQRSNPGSEGKYSDYDRMAGG